MAIVNFENKKMNLTKLISFGFSKDGAAYSYVTPIVNDQFQLRVSISKDDQIETHVIDQTTNEEYVLHLAAKASGEFVGQVAAEYRQVLAEIKNDCYDDDVFKSSQAITIIKYVNKIYENQLEFLWEKFPKNAIWRRNDTHKWYGALLTVKKSKLGIDSEEEVTVLDMRGNVTEIEKIVDGQNYFPGYHMNKKNWYTIILDDSVANNEIFERLQDSYALAK
ncbi:MmcQ/YjbR family DNA-binding protein [Companilactobacillus kimchiensis]|uniref:MmcQ family protein n=1 Tax=Companilactobacillus kimchiensis TaxID=993692 RepID=A0A0R2LGV6_9LACO|nr:MmcQ/YjbR family DNA-binding protein [Companilactobacillus kimchiensis]KRO00769.1 hypothetical protein IV57_GL000089 [Companilactobacillus kimchiensis]